MKTQYDELLVAKFLKDSDGPQEEVVERIIYDDNGIPVHTANTDDERVQQKLKDLSEDDIVQPIGRPTLSISQALPTASDNTMFGDYLDHTTMAKEKLAQSLVAYSYNEKIELFDIPTPTNPPKSLEWNTCQLAEQTTPISSVQPNRQQLCSPPLGDDYIPLASSNLFDSTASGYIDNAQYSQPATSEMALDDIDIMSTSIDTLALLVDRQVLKSNSRNCQSPPPLEQRPCSAATYYMSESSGIVSPSSSMESVFQSNTSDIGPSNHQRRLSSGFPDTPLSPDQSKPAFPFPDVVHQSVPVDTDYIPDCTVLSSTGSCSTAIDRNAHQTLPLGSSSRSVSPLRCNDTIAKRVSLPSCTLSHISEEHLLAPSRAIPQEPPLSDYIPHPPISTTDSDASKNSRQHSLPVIPLSIEPANPSILSLMYTRTSGENTATAIVSDEVVANITSRNYLPPLSPFLSRNPSPTASQAHSPTPPPVPSLLRPQDASVRPATLPLCSLEENRRLSPLGQSSSSSSSMSSQDGAAYSLPSTTSSIEEFLTASSGVSSHLCSRPETNNNQYL